MRNRYIAAGPRAEKAPASERRGLMLVWIYRVLKREVGITSHARKNRKNLHAPALRLKGGLHSINGPGVLLLNDPNNLARASLFTNAGVFTEIYLIFLLFFAVGLLFSFWGRLAAGAGPSRTAGGWAGRARPRLARPPSSTPAPAGAPSGGCGGADGGAFPRGVNLILCLTGRFARAQAARGLLSFCKFFFYNPHFSKD